jgi:tetratricopeptide (TPR) repeat protein
MNPRLATTSAKAGAKVNFIQLFRNFPFNLGVVLFVLAVCTFLPTLRNDFINFDDPVYVTENVHVNLGLSWASFKWAFHGTDGGIWLPLTWISHMLDCQIYGLKPWGHHLTSVLIHATTTVFVFLWLFRMTGAKWRSFVVAALFGLHPLRVESVAWVAERKDVLSVMFWFLTLLAYTEYAKRRTEHSGTKKVYALTLLFFVLGLMCKPMLVTLPFVLLLLDYWPLNRLQDRKSVSQLLFEKWPFFVLSMLGSVIAYTAEKHEKIVVSLALLPPSYRIENALISYVQYIGKTFWPQNLCVFYPYPEHISLVTVCLAAILLVIVSVVSIWQWRRQPYLLIGWLWFLGTLLPVIGLVQLGEQAMADRYTYIPEIGLLFCVVWGGYALTKTWKRQVLILSMTAMAVIIACMMLTYRQIGYWRDNETLFGHAIAITEDNETAHMQRGVALLQEGYVNEAMGDFQKSLEINPHDDDVYDYIGVALCQLGRTNEAIAFYKKALEINPTVAEGYNNMGSASFQMGRTTEAINYFQKSLEIQPNDALECDNLGLALSKLGRTAEAIDCYKKGLTINPDDAETYSDLGSALYQQGRMDEAIACYKKVLELKPDNVPAYNNLGTVLCQVGRMDEAISYFEKSLQIEPNDTAIYRNLGLALFQLGRTAEAIDCYKKGLTINPDDAETQFNFGNALYQQGQVDEAILHYQKALEISPNHAGIYRNLGVAFYKTGRVNEAISSAQKALQLATAQNNSTLAATLQKQIEFYQANVPAQPEHP